MTDKEERNEPEMAAARSAWKESVEKRQPNDPAMPSEPISVHQRPAQSNQSPTRHPPRSYATAAMASSPARPREDGEGHRTMTEEETDIVKAMSVEARPETGGFMSGVARALGVGQGSSSAYTNDPATLQKKVRKLERSNARMEQELRDQMREITMLEREKANLQSRLQRARQDIKNNDDQAREAMMGLKAALDQSNARTSALQQQAAEDEEKLGKAYSAVVSNFAQDVSRDMPDDLVKNEISAFFQGDFFSWCADMCTPRIENQQSAAEHLRAIGILNSDQEYLRAPPYLQFDMDLPDGSSPLVLLQAALARVLCDNFLASPFFLSKQHQALKEFGEELSKGDKIAAVEWRMQTVACLESIAPLDPALSAAKAKEFETEFGFLLQELDEVSREDLVNLFTGFATLCLRLWKIRTDIAAFGMPGFGGARFDLGSEHMDGEQVTVSSLGPKLNGRPIGVVMRPLIVAEPVVAAGKPHPQVVWSRALVWVSPHMPADEVEMSG